jgi:hypothetical protein
MSLKDTEEKFLDHVASSLDADDCTIEEKVEFLKQGFDEIPRLMMERHGLGYDTACRMVAECMMVRGHYLAKRFRGEISKKEFIRMRDMIDNLIIEEYSRMPTIH